MKPPSPPWPPKAAKRVTIDAEFAAFLPDEVKDELLLLKSYPNSIRDNPELWNNPQLDTLLQDYLKRRGIKKDGKG